MKIEKLFLEILTTAMVIRLPLLAAISAFVLAVGLAAASNAHQELLKRQLCCEGCPVDIKVCEFYIDWSVLNRCEVFKMAYRI